ncbi:hypothetical protein DH09_07810 [Bacillaceae bacterium JMAK1]|nr:hypothetical protein DH09_07810 [Bacillaceae bacterium JMAK1]
MIMSKKTWLGTVVTTIEGEEVESFINACTSQNIQFMNVERTSMTSIRAVILIEDVRKFRKIARKRGLVIRFLERDGMYVIKERSKKRFGFIIGIVAFCVALGLLSQLVWKVDIEGASPLVEQDVREWAEQEGLKVGQPQWRLAPEADIQQRVTEEVEGATWIGVEKIGTKYQFRVVEQHLAEEQEQLTPRHLIANKNGVIQQMYVENGRAVVKSNDVVQKGELLVSGLIGREGEETAIAAKGEVMAETWYQGTVEAPLQLTGIASTGETKNQYTFSWNEYSFVFWGKDAQDEYEQFHTETDQLALPLGFVSVPLPIERTTYEQRDTMTIEYSEDEAIGHAVSIGKNHLEQQLDNDAKIIAENILQTQTDNGKVKLSIHYQVVENIVQVAPIQQGD